MSKEVVDIVFDTSIYFSSWSLKSLRFTALP